MTGGVSCNRRWVEINTPTLFRLLTLRCMLHRVTVLSLCVCVCVCVCARAILLDGRWGSNV